MFRYLYEALFIVVGIVILVVNNIFIVEFAEIIVPIVNMIGGLIVVVPPTLVFYATYKKNKQIEQQFLVFIRELTESINTGMTLPMALQYTAKKNYLALTPMVKNLAAQVDWGIPFERALETFAKTTNSVPIRRAISTIIQTYKMGGKISDTLAAIGKSLLTIERIRTERSTSVRAQIMTVYLIYFVFIFILITLQVFLIPSLQVSEDLPGITANPAAVGVTDQVFVDNFIIFIIIQGFFAGIVAGKMSEGSVVTGFKHSILLIIAGYTIFTLAIQIQIPL
ncbi:MAG: type II secretion system F family protein [Candidatus Aenigmatarchaeota archaeon]